MVSAYVVHGLVLAVWLRFGRTPEGGCVCLRTLPDLPGRPSLTIAAIFLWAYGLLLAGTLLRRWLFGLPEPRRHVFAPVALAGVPAVLVLGAREGLSVLPADPPGPLRNVLDTVALFLLVLWPLGLLAGFVRVRLDQAAVGALADRLGVPTAPRSLETSLGVVLHDPTLRLAYRVGDSADYVDGDQQPVSLPLPGSGRSVTPLRGSAEPVAVLIHDAGLDAEPELVRSAAAVARLVLDNERMRAELAGARGGPRLTGPHRRGGRRRAPPYRAQPARRGPAATGRPRLRHRQDPGPARDRGRRARHRRRSRRGRGGAARRHRGGP
ncbi:hypothetical protein GCM10029978_101460 [Actinoallomurus acanthiterrae]